MSQLQVDPTTGDLVRSGGTFQRVTDFEEIAQYVRVRLRLFQGENVFDQSLGVPYIGDLLTKGVQPTDLTTAYRATIEGTAGVVSVSQIDVEQSAADVAARVAAVNFRAEIDTDDSRNRIPLSDEVTVPIVGVQNGL